jgi:hypothetical protein
LDAFTQTSSRVIPTPAASLLLDTLCSILQHCGRLLVAISIRWAQVHKRVNLPSSGSSQ